MKMKTGAWIWLDPGRYPDLQQTNHTVFDQHLTVRYCIAEFRKSYTLSGRPESLEITVSGDTRFRFWVNGRLVGMGPVCPGGDFANTAPMPEYYENRYTLPADSAELTFFAQVQLSPSVQTDVSAGRGGFYLTCRAVYADGSTQTVGTDQTWQARPNEIYQDEFLVDYTKDPGEWSLASAVKPVWSLKPSPIPNLAQTWVDPQTPFSATVAPGETREFTVVFDKIYSAYIFADVQAQGPFTLTLTPFEVETDPSARFAETVRGDRDVRYQGFRMQSLSGLKITAGNQSTGPLTIQQIRLLFVCYPVLEEGTFRSSDPQLDQIYDVGKWTLQICRQSIHLDSPMHQENLGCAGDYFIEGKITYFTFGDPRLIRFDLVRIGSYIQMAGGIVFHTTYSLIWVQMLWEYYWFTGDQSVLQALKTPLSILLDRFKTYQDENGVIDSPPNFMFVDWIPVDEFNLHHPPKALGQTVMNAFYYQALRDGEQIYSVLADGTRAAECKAMADRVRESFNRLFYDKERGLYFAGLNTESAQTSGWLPPNPPKRYYGKHENTLAVLYGLCPPERAKPIMEHVMKNPALTDVQPYFMHFVLDALYQAGLFGQYGLAQIRRWEKQIKECSKGMKEAWGDYPGYHYDFSHAWGATPTYQLPCRLMGFSMVKPGFAEISLAPDLFGLETAHIEMPTPYGKIIVDLRQGMPPKIQVPAEIRYTVRGADERER